MSQAGAVPELFAIVDVNARVVLARGLNTLQAAGCARAYTSLGKEVELLPELITWPTDGQVLQQLQLVR